MPNSRLQLWILLEIQPFKLSFLFCVFALATNVNLWSIISTFFTQTEVWNLLSLLLIEPRVCVCAQFYQFLPLRSYFVSKRPENFVRIAKFPYAAFGPLFAFHCPLFFTRNNNLQCKSSRFAVVVRSSVADRQLHLNGVIRSAGVAEWQELGPKT